MTDNETVRSIYNRIMTIINPMAASLTEKMAALELATREIEDLAYSEGSGTERWPAR